MDKTQLSRRWLIKIAIFMVASTGLGLWGLYDATIAYPARGEAHAEYMEYQYLLAMGQAGLPVVPISDPRLALKNMLADRGDLETRRAQAEAQGQTLEMNRAAAGLVLGRWLESLKVIGNLDAEHTTITNPRERFSVLTARWQARDQPKPLAGFDLPMQWGFVIIGFGLTGYLLLLVAMVGSKKYRYDPETKQLTFPGGVTITPADIEDINKRKWDKFIVQIKSDGVWRKLDLLRYHPLEDWYLEMEKETSFFEPPEDDDAVDAGDSHDVSDDVSDDASDDAKSDNANAPKPGVGGAASDKPLASSDEGRATETA